ncbi:RE2 [Symbiodinium sp. CCMP2592]|nr:RE2 [Symbiodinium sp. CCMP2592]
MSARSTFPSLSCVHVCAYVDNFAMLRWYACARPKQAGGQLGKKMERLRPSFQSDKIVSPIRDPTSAHGSGAGSVGPDAPRVRGPNRHPSAATSEWWGWWDWDSDWSSQEEAPSSQAPQGAKGSGAAEAPARPRRPLIGERTEAPNQNRGRTAEPEKGKGKTGPSAGRPASESGSRTPRRGEKGAGKPTKGKPAKGAAQPAKGKAAQAKGAEQPAKGKPAPAGKSGKGKPAAQEPAQGSEKKKNHRGGRSQAARATREARRREARKRGEGPGTDIPEPRTAEETEEGAGQVIQSPSSESSLDTAAVFQSSQAPRLEKTHQTPKESGKPAASSSSGAVPAKKEEPAERVVPPASAEAAAEPAEEAKPEASPKPAPKAAEAKEESSVSPSSEAGQEQAAPASRAEGLTKRRSGSEGPTVKAPPPHLGPPPPLKEEPRPHSQGQQSPRLRYLPRLWEEAPEQEQEPTSPANDGDQVETEESSSEGQGPSARLSSTRQEMSQQPAYPPPQGDPVVEALRGEVATLRGLLESQAQQLQAAIGELAAQRQQTQGLAAAAAPAAPAPAPAQASGGGHLLKSMRLPAAFKGRDDWERFAFQAESYLAVVDTRYPAELEVARKCKVPLQMTAMTEEVRTMSVRLFGMLGSWTQDSATAVKLARGVKGQNGFELWRLLWQEHNPENESKNLTWRRTLLMPKFPPKESDFSLALQEWEADVDRYASEYGAGRALADEDLRAVLVTESPNALRQHLAMHAASLRTYAEVREVVVSYLQAKRVWTPSAGYAASSRRDPNAMDIGRIGDHGKEGKGKGDQKGKKGDKDHKKGKGDHDNKGKKGDKKGNQQGGRDGKERCPICWKTGHTVKECWFNAKGKGKGNKGQVAQVADDAATTLSTASLATAGPSASQAGGSTGGSGGKGQVRQVRDDRILGVRFAPPHDTEPEEEKILKVSGSLLVDSGACVSVCRPEAFPDLQPAGPPRSLYSVDNSRLKTKGRVQPSLLLGEERQSCKVNFEVTEDIEDEILSISRAVEAGAGIWLHQEDSHILWPDGVRASILKRGSQFLLPYERELPPGSTNWVAPVAPEPPSPGRDLGHYEYIPEHDLEAREEQAEQPDSRPRGLRAPRNPTAQERAEHELTHTPYQAWCEKTRTAAVSPLMMPLVTMDYQFYSRDGKEVEEEASLATVLNLTDRATGWTLSIPVAHKGHRYAAYAAGLVEQFVDRLGYDKFTLQADQENALASVARAVHRRLGAARVRTWLSRLRADYPALEWDTSSNLFPWLVRHVAWLQARFGTKSTDGVTPYRAATGTDYGGALCSFGETVLAKLPRPGNKAQVRWVKGVWTGKLERDDSHVVLTEADLAAQRQPMMVPIPLATPAEEVERLEPPGEPWLFHDDEALPVEGAEQASRLPDASPTEELANADIPGERDAWVGQVTDLLDRMLDPKQVEQARKEQLRKLWDRGAFTPVLRSEVPRGARYSPEQEAGMDVFVPTPTPESHSLLEVAALHNEGWVTRSLDIVAAFLIGRDRGAAEGCPVYMHAPVEWRELFDQWVLEQPAKDQQWYRDHFRDFVFRVDGNLYGRRTAGSVYRDELEEVLTGKLSKEYDFQRGVKGPCVFLDRRSGLILLHHIDDIRVAGPKAAVLKFTEVDLPAHCEITVGELEEPGTAVEDSILTLPDSKHAENVCEQLGIGPKDKGVVPSKPLDLSRFRSAVGSAIYLSADRRDIQFAVKELARRMQNPRICDWLAAETLARYLRATPRFGRVVVLDPASKSTALLNLEVYSDSDWAGEAVFLRELAEKDFALACGLPRLWADSAASIGAAKRIGPGSKLRHLEVAEFFVQGALRAKLLELRKVKGTENPANFATKHAKTGPEVRQSLPSMGMVDLDAVAGAAEALAQKGTIKTIQASPWKMSPPTKLPSSALMATIVALQVRPAKAQGHDFAELVLGFAALGFLAFLWMFCRPEAPEEAQAEAPNQAQAEAPNQAQAQGGGQQPRGAQEPEPEGERTPGPPPAAHVPPPPPPAAPRAALA